jgi:hypothetical protein
MPTKRDSGLGCALRGLAAWALFVIGVPALTVGGCYFAARVSLQRAEEAWATRVEPMESFIARYPTEPDNPAALELDVKTRPLGIRLTDRTGEEPREGPHDELLKELSSFIGDRAGGGTDELGALAPEARAFLERERAPIEAIEAQILQGGTLRWKQDITKGVAAPIPGLLGHRQVHTLLLARAWEAARQGRPREAERALEASWVLGGSLEERPDLISRLIVVAVSTMQHRVLRAARLPPDRWLPRLEERGFADGMQAALQLEAWSWTRYAEGDWGMFDVDHMERGEKPPRTIGGDLGRFLTVPYMRLSFAGMSASLLRANEELRAQRRCDFDVQQYAEEFKESYPRWNILARIAVPSLLRAWASLRYADFDRELTEQVLVFRTIRRSSGSWPTGTVPSRVCADVSWVLEAHADGSLIVQPSEAPFVTDKDDRDWSIRLRP